MKSEKAFFEFMRDYEICPQLMTKSSVFQVWANFSEVGGKCVYDEVAWGIVL